MYQTLYRKYRPLNLDEVVGQQVIVKTLKNAILNNQLSHKNVCAQLSLFFYLTPSSENNHVFPPDAARLIPVVNRNQNPLCA